MTRRQVLGLCIAVSFFLHIWALRQDWGSDPASGGDELVMPADFVLAASAPAGASLALEQAADSSDDGQNAERAAQRLRRLARRQYFQKVHEAIERRKFQYAGELSHLIGNVLYSFRILPNDTFTDIRLKRSSGDPLLDRAAKNAILSASGRVKRPKFIQGQTFTLSVAVKYQRNM
jgi:protein TonB